MDEFISSNPCNFDHASLFEMVQRLTLDHRLNDSYSCLASIPFDVQQLQRDIPEKHQIPLYLYVRTLPTPYKTPLTIISKSLIFCMAEVLFTQESM
jgi:hypothetical protein